MTRKTSNSDKQLKELMDMCRTINVWIRRNVIEGYIDRMTASQHEVRTIHKMRKMLSEYYKEPLSYFEPQEYLEKKQ